MAARSGRLVQRCCLRLLPLLLCSCALRHGHSPACSSLLQPAPCLQPPDHALPVPVPLFPAQWQDLLAIWDDHEASYQRHLQELDLKWQMKKRGLREVWEAAVQEQLRQGRPAPAARQPAAAPQQQAAQAAQAAPPPAHQQPAAQAPVLASQPAQPPAAAAEPQAAGPAQPAAPVLQLPYATMPPPLMTRRRRQQLAAAGSKRKQTEDAGDQEGGAPGEAGGAAGPARARGSPAPHEPSTSSPPSGLPRMPSAEVRAGQVLGPPGHVQGLWARCSWHRLWLLTASSCPGRAAHRPCPPAFMCCRAAGRWRWRRWIQQTSSPLQPAHRTLGRSTRQSPGPLGIPPRARSRHSRRSRYNRRSQRSRRNRCNRRSRRGRRSRRSRRRSREDGLLDSRRTSISSKRCSRCASVRPSVGFSHYYHPVRRQ